MIEFELDVESEKRRVLGFGDVLDRQQPKMLGQIGQFMEERTRADFLVKSRGGTGIDGTKWPKVTPAEANRKDRTGNRGLGIRSGELLASLTYTIGGQTAYGKPLDVDELAIEFTDQPKANAFNATRPLLPSSLPNPWYRASDRMVQTSVDQLAAQHFSE